MEEDDPVVQEIPIFLSQSLAENLYIFQYPVKPANREWNNAKVLNASIKPKNQAVRLEVGLDTYSDTYCPSKGEQIALNTDGHQEARHFKDKEHEKGPFFKSGMMDKIVLEGSSAAPDTHHYALAVLQDKELHCTPIKGIIQLRPSHAYFDKQDKRKKDIDKTDNSDEDEEETEAQQVTVKFARQETELAKKAREKSFEFISKKSMEEPWYDAVYRHDDTDYADLERLKLFSASPSSGASLSLGVSEYVRALVPYAGERGTHAADATERCRELLVAAGLMTYEEVRTRVAAGSEGALLSALGAAGVLVRGLWAARSGDLYTQPSAGAGVPARLMCAARDHVLYLFTQSPYVERVKVTAAVRLPPREVLQVLRTVAKYTKGAGWELLLTPDTAFERKHPEVVQRQNSYWEAKQRRFDEMMIGETPPKRQRKKSGPGTEPKPRCHSLSEEDTRHRRTRHVSAHDH